MNKSSILTYCPNYNKIINFEFLKSDYISEKLITFYKNYIYTIDINNKEECLKAQNVDIILNTYINDYIFRREMKNELLQIKIRRNIDDVLKIIIDNIIRIFKRYKEGITRKIYISRWI